MKSFTAALCAVSGLVLTGAACAKAPAKAPARRIRIDHVTERKRAALMNSPLMTYVRKPDPSYKWEKTSERELDGGVSLTELMLTSQTWQGHPWRHHLTVLKPKNLKAKATGLLYITGNYHPQESALFAPMVAAGGQPLFILWDIPNQPLFGDLNEDALISYTFVKYLETQDATWPLLFPMTKGAVRAMDAAQALARETWKSPLSGFVVTGASKRGWTTWLTGAADPRVKGIAPMVFDNLNFGAQMKHQLESWGKYSEQIEDYTEKGLQEKMTTPEGRRLMEMVDPYSLHPFIKIPKLIINGTNDRYWTLDSANIYFKELAGPKDILYVPNAGHGLQDFQRVLNGISAFWSAVSVGKNLPQLRGEFNRSAAGGADQLQLMVHPGARPKAVRAWWATADTLDFREAKWEAVPADPAALKSPSEDPTPGVHWLILPDTDGSSKTGGEAVVELIPPAGKYAALFAEAEYAGERGTFNLSTQVAIIGPKGAAKPAAPAPTERPNGS